MNVEQAFEKKISNVPITVDGQVLKVLADDSGATPHQKFVVEIHSGHTVLIAHNTQRAYRVPVKLGDKIEVRGTYVWNKHGGLIHNTHHDDRKACEENKNGHIVCGPKHEDGWVIYKGTKNPQL